MMSVEIDSKKKSAPPKLHKFMHPRNPYKTPPSFKNLAQKYADFRAHCMYEVDGKVRLNFKDPKAVRELTTCLLDQDFGLKVSIPDGRLVPTLPLRFNYLLWIEDLLTLSANRGTAKNLVVGVDIGCGASCIYPLLAAKQSGWCMVGTEADEVSFDSAAANVKNNGLENQIFVQKVEQHVILKSMLDEEEVVSVVNKFQERKRTIPDSQLSGGENTDSSEIIPRAKGKSDNYLFDFTMCNPPFFGSIEETDSMSKSKKDRGEPTSAPTGAVQETVTEGGEVAFINQMIDESVLLKEKVRIFTTMIGSKAHVKEVKDKLRAANPAHSAVVEFCQGRTMRWGIAWTFNPCLHLENVMSKKQMVDNKPLVLLLPRSLMTVYTVRGAWAMVNKWLHQLKLNVQVFKNTKYFVGANVKAYKPTWLHQRRKKRERQRNEVNPNKDEESMETLEDTEVTTKDEFSLKRTAEEAELEQGEKTEPEGRMKRQNTQNKEDSEDSGMDNEDNQEMVLDDSKCSPQKLKETLELQSELPKSLQTESNNGTDAKVDEEISQEEIPGGLECILKAKLQLKQNGGLISLEALYLRGSAGKDGLNQILQYMRNKLTNPHS